MATPVVTQQPRSSLRWWVVGGLPIALFLVPALLGHPLVFGDNATQNVPLRTLVGEDWRAGVLPAWNPYDWSGVPLLAGFNAGALTPFILPFVFLPAGVAFSLAIGSAFGLIALATAATARVFGVSERVAALAGLVFALTGAVVAQSVHMDMIEGDAGWVVAMYFLSRLVARRGSASANMLGLAAGYALDILAGAPESMLAGLMVLATSGLVWVALRRLGLRQLVAIAIGALLALGLAAAQWIPGLAFTAVSTRAHLPHNFAGSGPFSGIFAPLAVYPMAFGGELINYFGDYNPYEINVSITYLGLAFLLVAALRPRWSTLDASARRALWAVAIVSLLFALGGHTPFAQVIYRLPLFDLQRLASRYLVGVDYATVLLAAGAADAWLADRGRLRDDRRLRWGLRVLGAVAVAFAFLEVVAPRLLLPLSNVATLPTGGSLLALRGYLVVMAGVVGAVTLTLLRHPRAPWALRLLGIALAFEVLNQVAEFPVLSSFAPPLSHPGAPSVAAVVGPPPARYVLYDPDLYLYEPLIATNAQPDTNITTGTFSASGYASLDVARYADATGTKPESTLDPKAIGTLVHTFNVRVLVTSRRYFWTFEPTLRSLRTTPSRLTLRGGDLDVFAGDIRATRMVLVELPPHLRRAVLTLHLADTTLQRRVSARTTTIAIEHPQALESIAIATATKASGPVRLVAETQRGDYLLGGPLSSALGPSAWRQIVGRGGSLDYLWRGAPATWALPTPSLRILGGHQHRGGSITLRLALAHRRTVILPFAWAPGWQATVDGHPWHLLSTASGAIELPYLPPGTDQVVLTYAAPRLMLGIALSLTALGAWILGVLGVWVRRTKVLTSRDPGRL